MVQTEKLVPHGGSFFFPQVADSGYRLPFHCLISKPAQLLIRDVPTGVDELSSCPLLSFYK